MGEHEVVIIDTEDFCRIFVGMPGTVPMGNDRDFSMMEILLIVPDYGALPPATSTFSSFCWIYL
jgi:hypothetical protein